MEATNKSANSQANEIAAIIENNVVENTKKSYVSTINKFIVWLTARKALLETQKWKLENLINARKQKSHVAENVNESGHPPLEDNVREITLIPHLLKVNLYFGLTLVVLPTGFAHCKK